MEHWHVPYTYPRADNVQAWLQKCLEGAIARNVERESNWMFKQRCVDGLILKRHAHVLMVRVAKPSNSLVVQSQRNST